MNAYVTYSVGEQDMDLVLFLSKELQRYGIRPIFGSYTSMEKGKVVISDVSMVSNLRPAHIVIVLITKKGAEIGRIKFELMFAKELNLPIVLLINKGETIPFMELLDASKIIRFDRDSINDDFLKDLKNKIKGASTEDMINSETKVFWLLGGLAIYGLFNELYENEKPKRKKKSSSK